MLKEQIDSPIHPPILSDFELLRFCEEQVYTQGLPINFQKEIVRRFANKIVQTRSY
jgi:hypothetical protein